MQSIWNESRYTNTHTHTHTLTPKNIHTLTVQQTTTLQQIQKQKHTQRYCSNWSVKESKNCRKVKQFVLCQNQSSEEPFHRASRPYCLCDMYVYVCMYIAMTTRPHTNIVTSEQSNNNQSAK